MDQLLGKSYGDFSAPFLQAWYGERYREFALDPEWFALSFVTNARKESDGSRKLWELFSGIQRLSFADQVRVHAADEARHARMYIAMLETVFPGSLSEADREELLGSFPQYGPTTPPADWAPYTYERAIDEIVQMNIGEIRTRIHQMLLRPVALAVASPDARDRLQLMLERIYEDECSHILYTAEILEREAREGAAEMIANLYSQRLRDFSEITVREVGVGSFD